MIDFASDFMYSRGVASIDKGIHGLDRHKYARAALKLLSIDGTVRRYGKGGGDKESSVPAALGDELSRRNSALLCFDFPAHGDSEAEDGCLRVDNCKNDLLRAAVERYGV